ncbi:MAG: MBL fold metallo-hydrolase [Planctomycetes bacterium]|nr:MBL fold metallo-hydrolase [Planctomycetota bacterium]
MVGDGRLHFSVLGSGSRGNSVLVTGGGTTLLVDAGLTLKETRARMASLGLAMDSVDAVLVTHEHSDHVSHAGVVARNLGVPAWIGAATLAASERHFNGTEETPELPTASFKVGALEVTPVQKPHDAADPVAFLVGLGDDTVGVFTDLGHVDDHVAAAIGRCSVLVMEANHDPGMLASGSYPWHVKRRVGGSRGHISNEDAARALARSVSPELRCLVLAHLSARNNHPELVRRAFVDHLGSRTPYQRWISYQDRATPLFDGRGDVVAGLGLESAPESADAKGG